MWEAEKIKVTHTPKKMKEKEKVEKKKKLFCLIRKYKVKK